MYRSGKSQRIFTGKKSKIPVAREVILRDS
jgi:hypothetical protein